MAQVRMRGTNGCKPSTTTLAQDQELIVENRKLCIPNGFPIHCTTYCRRTTTNPENRYNQRFVCHPHIQFKESEGLEQTPDIHSDFPCGDAHCHIVF